MANNAAFRKRRMGTPWTCTSEDVKATRAEADAFADQMRAQFPAPAHRVTVRRFRTGPRPGSPMYRQECAFNYAVRVYIKSDEANHGDG